MNFQIKVTLRHVKPAVWRRLIVAVDTPLDVLHHIIQMAMPWEDCHLHEFGAGQRRYGIRHDDFGDGLDEGVLPEEGHVLGDLVRKPKDKLVYWYDFGDDYIVVEAIQEADAQPVPRCLAGARAAPPDDCGGPWGYANLLKVLRNPKHEEHEETKEWVGDAFDPEHFDPTAVNRGLARLRTPARRRRKA